MHSSIAGPGIPSRSPMMTTFFPSNVPNVIAPFYLVENNASIAIGFTLYYISTNHSFDVSFGSIVFYEFFDLDAIFIDGHDR